jgi:hypothetical protein
LGASSQDRADSTAPRRGDSAGGQASNETENRIEGKVLSSTFLGDQVEGRILIAKALAEDQRAAGKKRVGAFAKNDGWWC